MLTDTRTVLSIRCRRRESQEQLDASFGGANAPVSGISQPGHGAGTRPKGPEEMAMRLFIEHPEGKEPFEDAKSAANACRRMGGVWSSFAASTARRIFLAHLALLGNQPAAWSSR